MTPSQGSDDLKRELQATLEARRELSDPTFDEHFIDNLAQRVVALARQEAAAAPRPRTHLSGEQRTSIAICSLIFGIPIIAIASAGGPAYFFAALALLTLINVFAAF